MVLVILLTVVSCSSPPIMMTESFNVETETCTESISNSDSEYCKSSPKYLQGKLEIFDDENHCDEFFNDNYFVYLSFVDETYESVFGVSNEEMKKELLALKLAEVDYQAPIYVRASPIVDPSIHQPQTIGDVPEQMVIDDYNLDMTSTFDSKIKLFDDCNCYGLYYMFRAQMNKTEYDVNLYFTEFLQKDYGVQWSYYFDYGMCRQIITPCFIFANSVDDAKTIETSSSDCSVIIYITEIIDHRERVGKQVLYGDYKPTDAVGSYVSYSFSRTKATICNYIGDNLTNTQHVTYVIDNDMITFNYEDGTSVSKSFYYGGPYSPIIIDSVVYQKTEA